MADQQNRGGQKQGQHASQSKQKRGENTDGAGERSEQEKRQDKNAKSGKGHQKPNNQ